MMSWEEKKNGCSISDITYGKKKMNLDEINMTKGKFHLVQ